MTLWLIETMATTTLLMGLVLLVRRPVAAAFGAQVAYALWLLPALRMVLPTLPGWEPWLIPADGRAVMAPEAGVVGVVSPDVMAGLPGDASPVDWGPMLMAGWALGALVFVAVQAWRYRRFMGAALRGAAQLTRIADIDVLVSPAVDGPMAAGIVRRRILLPVDFASRYDPAERRLALLHEGAHHDRRDLVANVLGLGVLALHWWNPVAHMAWRAFRADQELACDATVLAGADADQRSTYAGAVLKSAIRTAPAAACAMNHVSQLKERLVMMNARNLGPVRMAAGVLTVALLTLGGLVATASGAQPAEPARAQVPPEPPMPAVPPEPPMPAVAPEPPEPPMQAVAPEPPMPPEMHKRVMIIKRGPEGQEEVMKDGKSMSHVRKIVIKGAGEGPDAKDVDALGAALDREIEAHLEPGKSVDLREMDGKRVVIIRQMGEAVELRRLAGEARAEAASEIAQAREQIAKESGMADDVRTRALAALDKALASIDKRR